MSFKKTLKKNSRKSVGGKKKKHNKRNSNSRKGRGYKHECLFPTPETHESTGKDSCSLIDLNDMYGSSELENLGIEGKNQCNMYYYLDNGNYYRCRNSNKSGTRCNKRGAYGSGKVKCGNSAIERIKVEEPGLLTELNELMSNSARPSSSRPLSSRPSLSSITSSRAPSYPSVPTHSVLLLPSVPSNTSNKQPIRTLQSGTRSSKSSMRSNKTIKVKDPVALHNMITKLNNTILKYKSLNAELLARKQKHLKDAKKPGTTRVMKRQIISMIRLINQQEKTNNKIIFNYTNQVNRLALLQ